MSAVIVCAAMLLGIIDAVLPYDTPLTPTLGGDWRTTQ